MNKKPWAMAGECAELRPIQTEYDHVSRVNRKAAPAAIQRRSGARIPVQYHFHICRSGPGRFDSSLCSCEDSEAHNSSVIAAAVAAADSSRGGVITGCYLDADVALLLQMDYRLEVCARSFDNNLASLADVTAIGRCLFRVDQVLDELRVDWSLVDLQMNGCYISCAYCSSG